MQKGTTNNPNGRPPGVANKITKELREILSDIIESEFESLPDRLEKLPDEKRLDVIVKLLPYIIPRHAVLKLEPQAAAFEAPDVGIRWIESSDEPRKLDPEEYKEARRQMLEENDC